MTIQQAPRTESGPGRTAGSQARSEPHHRRAGRDLRPAPARLPRAGQPGQPRAGRRGGLQLADHPPAAGLAEPRPRLQAVRRRRQRVRRPARRLRRLAGRARPPGDRGRDHRPGAAGHPLRPAHAQRDPGRRGAVPPVRPAAVAVRQLRHRGHHGRGAPDARGHRPGPDHQGGGLLPRPPRLGPGVGHAPTRARTWARPAPRIRSRPAPASPRRSWTSPWWPATTTSAAWPSCWTSTRARSPG